MLIDISKIISFPISESSILMGICRCCSCWKCDENAMELTVSLLCRRFFLCSCCAIDRLLQIHKMCHSFKCAHRDDDDDDDGAVAACRTMYSLTAWNMTVYYFFNLWRLTQCPFRSDNSLADWCGKLHNVAQRSAERTNERKVSAAAKRLSVSDAHIFI